MGKDGDKNKGGPAGSVSRDDLKADHCRLVAEERRLASKVDEVKAVFSKLEQTYAASKESFSLNRYGQLKEMIKAVSSEEVSQDIRRTAQKAASGSESGKGGLAALLKKAQEFSSESQNATQQQEQPAAKPKGRKMSGFMKKLKNMTGFNDEPITDEDVMSNSDLQRDNGRKQRAISRYQTQLEKAAGQLEKLQHAYQASKAHAPPTRYTELKAMIKETVAEKMV